MSDEAYRLVDRPRPWGALVERTAEWRWRAWTRWSVTRRRARLATGAVAGRADDLLGDRVDRHLERWWPVRWQARVAAATLVLVAVVTTTAASAVGLRTRNDDAALVALTRASQAAAPRAAGPDVPLLRRPVEVAPPVPAAPKAPTTAAAAPKVSAPAGSIPRHPALPIGKGMWIWLPERVEGGDVTAIVARARAAGLSHVFVRIGSTTDGFVAGPFLDRLLPAAHAAGLRVYGWDFPTFRDVRADVERARTAVFYTTPDGHRIDGFTPDIETRFEGTNLSADNVVWYGSDLRAAVGLGYPLIATVPRPAELTKAIYPYAQLLGPFDAVAPMVYWLNRQPDADVSGALDWLRPFGKRLYPIGQAYDGSLEGGRPGPPTVDEIRRFFIAASNSGAGSVSFWSWQHADPQVWNAIAISGETTTTPVPAPALDEGGLRRLQGRLTVLGYPTPSTGRWDATTVDSVRAFQIDARLPVTGQLDPTTAARIG